MVLFITISDSLSFFCHPCMIHIKFRRSYVIYNIEYFALAVDSNTFKSSVHGIILGLPVPYGVPHGSLSGPIVSGQEVTYTNTLYVSPAYPKVKYYLYYCMYSTCIIKRFITHTCCFSVYLYLTILLS